MPVTKWDELAAYPIALAPPAMRQCFAEIAEPLLTKIHLNVSQNTALAEARDALLLELLSDEVRAPVAHPREVVLS